MVFVTGYPNRWPEFYMGWIIQPYRGGFLVYEREDYSKPKGEVLPTLIEAYEYIDGKTKGV